ncbi:hypothetical protein PVAP13_2NG547006, partial [Panicum virgatum]
STPRPRHGSPPVLHCGLRPVASGDLHCCLLLRSSIRWRWVWSPWIRRATGVCADRTTVRWHFLAVVFLPAMVFPAPSLFSPSPSDDITRIPHATSEFRPGAQANHGPVQPRQRQAAVPRADELRPPVNIQRVLMMIAEAAAALQACPVTPTGKETYSARSSGELVR